MSHSFPSYTVQDALDDIDMELLQDAVQRDDLGQSVQNARRFQQEARQEMLGAATARPDYRALATRQFQLNDMLLTLLQELATRQRSLELELRVYAPHGAAPGSQAAPAAPAAPPAAAGAPAGSDASQILATAWDDWQDDERTPPPSEMLVRRLDEIQAVMRDDALALQLEVTPNDTPVVGRLIGNLRAAVHSLVVFYGNQLGARQTEINRVFGGAIQQLLLQQARDQAHLAAGVEALAAEVAALRTAGVQASGSSASGSSASGTTDNLEQGREHEQP
jgi:hypothetical protein